MSVEFDEFSRDEQPSDDAVGEVLPQPGRRRRRWIAVGTAAAVVLVAGGVAVALTDGPASAAPAALAAAASSSAASGSAAPKPHPTGTEGRRGGPLGAFGGQSGHPVLFGMVKSVSGTTIDITDQQGFTRAIVTSSKTTYKDGLTASPKVGTKIIAAGTVDANGTSLDATTISAPPTPPTGSANAKGGGHPGGPGGPGGFGHPGARPSGAPTGSFTPGAHRPAPTATTTS